MTPQRRRFALAASLALFAVPMLAGAARSASAAPFRIKHLRAEMKVDPIGLDVPRPRLSWQLEGAGRARRQTAYQIVASRTRAGAQAAKADLWDSGKVDSNQTVHVEYDGTPLRSGEAAFWRVRVWDEAAVQALSPVAMFEMGLLEPTDFKAKWIGLPPSEVKEEVAFDPKPLKWIAYPKDVPSTSVHAAERFYRARIELPATPVRRAHFTLTAADQFILRINGETAGGARNWKQLERIDVAELLAPGKNVIAIQVRRKGDPGAFAGQLRVELADGNVVWLSTDNSWKTTNVRNAAWLANSFDDGAWVAAEELAAFGAGPYKEVTAAAIKPNHPTAPAYLRRSFEVRAPIKRARLYATALGVYELALNGRRVGDFVLAPGWTDYNKRVLYQTYDVTPLVRRGDNVLGAIVAEGWYAGRIGWMPSNHGSYGPDPQKLWAQLELELADGTRTSVTTDGQWQAAFGPLLASDLMDGEIYDARKELAGWDRPTPTPSGSWRKVDVYEAESRNLVADPGPPIRVVQELKAKSVREPKPGVFVYDLGQNMVGVVRLRVRGAAGRTVRVRASEMLNADGTLYTENLRAIKVTDKYTLKGGGEEVYEPRFTFHGFRYVEVTGYPGKPTLASITGRVIHSDTPATGTLVTSNAMLNQLQHNIVWGQKGNFLSVPTDCPQRDERLGWMGDAQIFVGTACFNMDVSAFFTKWMNDVADAQSPEGAFPDVAPRLGTFNDGAPAWGDAGVIVPWTMYQCTGDRGLLDRHYKAMSKWIEYIREANPNLLWTKRAGNNYGDWVSIDAETDKGVLATAYFALSTRLMRDTARVLGKNEDASRYDGLYQAIRAAFQRAYVHADGRVTSNTQTAYLLALRFDLLPPELRPKTTALLAADIEKRGGHLSTGFLGVGHLLPGLSENGRLDVAYKLLLNDTFPSWGYSIKQGATTIWERWDGWTEEKGFQTPAMNSFNHYAFGSAGEWMYRTIGGIDAGAPGYEEIVIRPQPGGGLTFAKAELKSVRGRIATDWKIAKGAFTLKVDVPMNARARVYLPFAGEHTEGGKAIDRATGIARRPDGGYDVGSGTYVFGAAASASGT